MDIRKPYLADKILLDTFDINAKQEKEDKTSKQTLWVKVFIILLNEEKKFIITNIKY